MRRQAWGLVVLVAMASACGGGGGDSSPTAPSPGGGGGGGGGLASVTDCGFGTFGSWYDAWIGYVGEGGSSFFGYAASAVGGIPIIGGAIASFLNGIGCVLAWVVVIIVIVVVAVLLLYIAWKGVEFVRG